MSPPQLHPQNRLLAALSVKDRALLQPDLEPVELPVHYVMSEPNEPVAWVYFLEAGLGSIVINANGTSAVEIGVVGNEGLVGIPVILGAGQSPHKSFMQMAGKGRRIASAPLQGAMAASPSLQACLLKYVHTFTVQVASTAYANADYTVEERLARWLLMSRDRSDGDEIALTHDFLALMLSARRPGVTIATHVLEGEHMIKARRGLITILDRGKLEATANCSYGIAEAEYHRLFGRG